jgi:poly(3-hydroxybutyrate) depolymerase
VLLHGCKQDSADFAQGTGMNTLAQQHQCLVLYPEQLAKSNNLRCWNWFERAHQVRGAGEPAMIAALTRDVLKARRGDPARVYIADSRQAARWQRWWRACTRTCSRQPASIQVLRQARPVT